ncbi:MAG: hypothetical protein ACRDKT_17970, partial [Actinomycetota bacterium]
MPDMSVDMTIVRLGTFSGIALSIREALRRRIDVADVDVQTLARGPALLAYRLAAHLEGRREDAPWAKTAAWSRATQRALERNG